MKKRDDTYKNMVFALAQLSETAKNALNTINMESLQTTQKMLSQYIENNNKKCFELSSRISTKQYLELQSLISNKLKDNYVRSDLLSGFSSEYIKTIADLQSNASLMASVSESTVMMKDLQRYLATSNLLGIVKTIQTTLDVNRILMADMAFFKTSGLINSFKRDLIIPYGFLTDIRELNKSSAIRLLNNKNISFRSDTRVFTNENNSDSKATVSEINVICGAEDVFDLSSSTEVFSENELMDFMAFLNTSPMMAMVNETGRKIFNVISSLPGMDGFDRTEYYHCRLRKKGEPPFVWEQMKAAPYGVTFPGRFNHTGQAYFYFADSKSGAENEIMKHMSEDDKNSKVLQTVQISAKGSVRLINLSEKSMRGLNTFLKYIRFPLGTDSSKRPRAYLIPSFVSECCNMHGIDGIKYYGGKDYSNYVTWKDGYFDFRGNV